MLRQVIQIVAVCTVCDWMYASLRLAFPFIQNLKGYETQPLTLAQQIFPKRNFTPILFFLLSARLCYYCSCYCQCWFGAAVAVAVDVVSFKSDSFISIRTLQIAPIHFAASLAEEKKMFGKCLQRNIAARKTH